MARRSVFAVALSLVIALSACGGGGGSGPASTAAGGGEAPVFSGTVAMGAPVQDAEVELRDFEGHVDTTISDASGGWIVPVSDIKRALKPPFIVRARFQLGGKVVDLFSMTTDDAGGNVKINVTPWSDMITRAYTWPSPNDPNAVEGLPNDPGKLRQIITGVREMAGAMAPSGSTDFIRDPFTPDPLVDAHDALIERTRIRYGEGTVSVTDVNDKVMAKRLMSSIGSGTPDTSDDGTVSKAEADDAKATKGAFPAKTAALVNEALKVVSAVTPGDAVVGKPVHIVVSGAKLGQWNGMHMSIEGCADVQDQGGTDTSRTFTCTPTSAGTKSGRMLDATTFRRLYEFTMTVNAEQTPVSPAVISVSPDTATVNTTTTFTVTGTNLTAGMGFTLSSCSDPVEVGAGTPTTRWFACAPLVTGALAGSISSPGGAPLKTFSVSVVAAPAAGPVVDSVSPTTAVLKEPTTYTVTGKNFVNGMRFTLEGCSGEEVPGVGTATTRQFVCASALSGANQGEIKDKVDGTVLKSFTVTITAAPAGRAVTCTGVSPAYPFNKYCYYIATSGQKKYHGPYEEYSSAAGTQLTKSVTYADGVLNGPAAYYAAEFLDTAYKGTYYLSAEGSYVDGHETGTWRYYWSDSYNAGVNSLGKLRSEATFGVYMGYPVAVVEKTYCPYGPGSAYDFPPSKAGQLAGITTLDLNTGDRTTQRFFKTGCQGPD